jgi:hypothetical protein
MIVDPSAAAGGSDTIRLRYLALAGSGAIEDDPAQRAFRKAGRIAREKRRCKNPGSFCS